MDAPSSSKAASHQPISLAKKLKIIEAVESGKKSKSAVAEEFSVAKVPSRLSWSDGASDSLTTLGEESDTHLLNCLRTEGVEISE